MQQAPPPPLGLPAPWRLVHVHPCADEHIASQHAVVVSADDLDPNFRHVWMCPSDRVSRLERLSSSKAASTSWWGRWKCSSPSWIFRGLFGRASAAASDSPATEPASEQHPNTAMMRNSVTMPSLRQRCGAIWAVSRHPSAAYGVSPGSVTMHAGQRAWLHVQPGDTIALKPVLLPKTEWLVDEIHLDLDHLHPRGADEGHAGVRSGASNSQEVVFLHELERHFQAAYYEVVFAVGQVFSLEYRHPRTAHVLRFRARVVLMQRLDVNAQWTRSGEGMVGFVTRLRIRHVPCGLGFVEKRLASSHV